MGLIQKYILPKTIDFDSALIKQANISKESVLDLCQYCTSHSNKTLASIIENEDQSRAEKSKNMHDLLDVFITPYDKESIYRIIIQLDWIALSVKHLFIDLIVYKIKCPKSYHVIFNTLETMSTALTESFTFLPKKELTMAVKNINQIHDNYDHIVMHCALISKKHLEKDEIKQYLAHREIINQLKDIAKRIHLCANSLEDMMIKIV